MRTEDEIMKKIAQIEDGVEEEGRREKNDTEDRVVEALLWSAGNLKEFWED